MSNSQTCQCCRRVLLLSESRIQTSPKTSKIFKKFIGFDLLEGIICKKCDSSLLSFDIFHTAINQKYTLLYEAINNIARIYCDEKLQDMEEEKFVENKKEIKIKQEPLNEAHEAIVVKTNPSLIDISHIKTEPEEEPQVVSSININDVIVKEEYEIKEDLEKTGEIEDENIIEELKTKEELEAESILSRSKEFVLKTTWKRKQQMKVNSAPKQLKSLALQIPDESIKNFDKNIIETVIVNNSFLTDTAAPSTIPISNVFRFHVRKASDVSRVIQFKCEHCTVISR